MRGTLSANATGGGRIGDAVGPVFIKLRRGKEDKPSSTEREVGVEVGEGLPLPKA